MLLLTGNTKHSSHSFSEDIYVKFSFHYELMHSMYLNYGGFDSSQRFCLGVFLEPKTTFKYLYLFVLF